MRESVGNRVEDNHGFNQDKSGGRTPRRGQPIRSCLPVRVVLGLSTVQVPGLPDGSVRPVWAHLHVWAKMMGKHFAERSAARKWQAGGWGVSEHSHALLLNLAPRKSGVNSTPPVHFKRKQWTDNKQAVLCSPLFSKLTFDWSFHLEKWNKPIMSKVQGCRRDRNPDSFR